VGDSHYCELHMVLLVTDRQTYRYWQQYGEEHVGAESYDTVAELRCHLQ